MTPAAVGHQIKGLELELGIALFERKTRKIMLTEAGRALSEHLGNALDEIEDAVGQARKANPAETLKITIAPFFGNRWLLPRLQRFQDQHPDIEIKPSLSFDYVDLRKSGFDAAVRLWRWRLGGFIVQPHLYRCCQPGLCSAIDRPKSIASGCRRNIGPTTGLWCAMARRLVCLGAGGRVKNRQSRENHRIRKPRIHV